MDFAIIDLLDTEASLEWLEKHFHPDGLRCPHCQAGAEQRRFFRVNHGSGLPVYRCLTCAGMYHLYSGTVFAGGHLPPQQVILLLQGILQGKSSKQLARELRLTEVTVLKWRHRLQAQAERLQPETPLSDAETESDEMFQNAGEKRRRTL
jgi:transposase-like protein